jgi:hypothetical protein
MKQLLIIALLGLSVSITAFAQNTSSTVLPDSVLLVVSHAPPPTKEQLAFRNIYQLSNEMKTIFKKDLVVTQKNIRDNIPLIMGLFNEAGGQFILYRPGEPPLVAPPAPRIYQIAKAAGHSALAAYGLAVPALKDSRSDQSWVAPMQAFRTQVLTAKESIDSLAMTAESKRRDMKLLLPPLAPLNSNEWPWIVNPNKGSGPRSLEDLHKEGYLPPLPMEPSRN